MSITAQSWFWWAAGLAVALPVLLVALTELRSTLKRRGSTLAGPVDMLRWVVVPLTALVVLLTQTTGIPFETNGVRVLATVLGLALLLLLLSLLNYVVFSNASRGSWRRRFPSIFVDIARIIVVGIGLAVLFSAVWGTDIGGLFAALGVTSIVLGLSLQGAIGSIVSGLLLLFEQPFVIGDWLQIGETSGRVIEVNWRSVHLDTGNSVEIIPNASLAKKSFRNLSRPAALHRVAVKTEFSVRDSPDQVCAMLNAVALDLPQRTAGYSPSSAQAGARTYQTTLTVDTLADADAAEADLRRRAWYAARRVGLHLDGAGNDTGDPAEVERSLRGVAETLHLTEADIPGLLPTVSIERYGTGETVQRVGQVPSALRILIAGRISMGIAAPDGSILPTDPIDVGDYIGQTTLTREPVRLTAVASSEVTFLLLPREVIDTLVRDRPELARDLGRTVDARRQRADAALAQARSLPFRMQVRDQPV